jgi:hypothetical protein
MRTNAAIRVMALFGLAVLSACASTSAGDHARASACRPGTALALVGRVAPDNAAILYRTHSKIIRRIAPGDAITMDFREERITVTVSEGRIISASCG